MMAAMQHKPYAQSRGTEGSDIKLPHGTRAYKSHPSAAGWEPEKAFLQAAISAKKLSQELERKDSKGA